MDFDGITNEATERTASLINDILKTDYSPADKIKLIVAAFSSVGETFAKKTFEDISRVYESENLQTPVDYGQGAQIRQLAQKIVRDSAFGIDAQGLTHDYFFNIFARSGEQAYRNAISLEKHPTITRTMTGRETCEFCRQRTGSYSAPTFSDLPTEIFRRHYGCDCLIRLSGAGTRSYKLNNYAKKG